MRLSTLLACLPLSFALLACHPNATIYRSAPGAIGPYSGSVEANYFVFASGKIASQREGSFSEEAHSATDAVEEQIAESGLSLDQVVSVTVYLSDIELYEAFNEVYAARFSEPYPARTCVAVAALPAGARVEITAIAAR